MGDNYQKELENLLKKPNGDLDELAGELQGWWKAFDGYQYIWTNDGCTKLYYYDNYAPTEDLKQAWDFASCINWERTYVFYDGPQTHLRLLTKDVLNPETLASFAIEEETPERILTAFGIIGKTYGLE